MNKKTNLQRGVLDKCYVRPEIDKIKLGELVDIISGIKLHMKMTAVKH